MLAERPKPDVDPGVAENVTVVSQASAPLLVLDVDASLPSTDPRRCTEATTLTAIVLSKELKSNKKILCIEVDGYVDSSPDWSDDCRERIF